MQAGTFYQWATLKLSWSLNYLLYIVSFDETLFVVTFMHCAKWSSVINLIYSGQQLFSYTSFQY
jgi:hypothetical protein